MRLRIFLPVLVAVALLPIFFIATPSEKIIEIQYSQLTKETQKQVDCLADNIYHEAGYEPEDGKVAVALVTLNRLQDPRFPKDICGVVKQKTRATCQFSWFCMKHKPAITERAREVYEQARNVAVHVYVNYEKLPDITGGALFYHADYVHPRWKLERTTVIGRHIFYKEKDDERI